MGNNNTEGKILKVLSGDQNAFLAPCEWKTFLNSRLSLIHTIIREEKEMQNTCDTILKEKVIVIVRGLKRDHLL